MTRKLSRWSKPGETPPMVGVWETDGHPAYPYQYWDGNCWWSNAGTPFYAQEFFLRICPTKMKADGLRFRGLATKPENGYATE